MARPRKSDLERHSNRFTLYLTAAEMAELEAKARKVNRQLAVYARDTALKKNKGYDSNADHSAPSTPARLRMHDRG